MKQILAITRKELEGYFGSPMALIFVGAYLAVTLFVFFWMEAFFARGVADVRPLFRWTPLLMIFLVAALTMRQWSEEARSGTLELLLTLPVSPVHLVLGKFLAVMAQVAVALALTFFLPITVSLLGNLDWGPVFGGYLAALLLAAAYTAVGLFVSSRTDNQIVSLIGTALLCGALYLVGSEGVVGALGGGLGDLLRAIGTGSRFASIERGVVDVRDLVYYLSLAALFLSLNILSLESARWGRGEASRPQRHAYQVTSGLLAANLILMNVWLYPLRGLRVDLTAQRQYSLSRATRDLLKDLREPLLIRGYFSEKTHPLLAPLVSNIRDMLEEYRVAGGGKVQVEMLDPATDPEKENEANQVYGIRPTPFQVTGRYETAIVNAYFDILIRYGDQSATLGFRDLIEVKERPDGTVDVGLRNLEYDLTSAIKKTVYGFQSVDTALASFEAPAELTFFVTPNALPSTMAEALETVRRVAQEIAAKAPDKLVYREVDPTAPSSGVTPQQLAEEYGIQPFAAPLFSDQTYYFHLILKTPQKTQAVYLTSDLSEASVRLAIESAIKRAAPGFLQVVGLWVPPDLSAQGALGQAAPQSLSSWQALDRALRQEYDVRYVNLKNPVGADISVLVLVAPQGLSDLERYHVDQFLMRGGTIIAAAGRYAVTEDSFTGGLALRPLENGVHDLLEKYGLRVEEKLVLDPQNEPFPVTVARQAGGMQFQEIRAINYPFFVDVRSDGMAAGHPIVSNLPAVTLNWASPIVVDEAANAGRQVTILLQSSPNSWTAPTADIQPNFSLYPELGFAQGEDKGRKVLAVAVQGAFDSAFKGQTPPQNEEGKAPEAAPIERSSTNARLVVIGSAEFLDDLVFDLSYRLSGDRYLNSLKLVQNAVAWATEDQELLAIRARGSYTRVLRPMSKAAERFWEAANYVVALAALLVIGAWGNARRRAQRPILLLDVREITQEEEVAR